jgi:hypothetical protein
LILRYIYVKNEEMKINLEKKSSLKYDEKDEQNKKNVILSKKDINLEKIEL